MENKNTLDEFIDKCIDEYKQKIGAQLMADGLAAMIKEHSNPNAWEKVVPNSETKLSLYK